MVPTPKPNPPSHQSFAPPTQSSQLSSEELEETLTRLTKQYFDSEKASELEKRFDTLYSSYRSSSLGPRIPVLLSNLMKSLDTGDIEGCENTFATLNADHGGQAANGKWCVALRHLLIKVKEKHKTESEATQHQQQQLLLFQT